MNYSRCFSKFGEPRLRHRTDANEYSLSAGQFGVIYRGVVRLLSGKNAVLLIRCAGSRVLIGRKLISDRGELIFGVCRLSNFYYLQRELLTPDIFDLDQFPFIGGSSFPIFLRSSKILKILMK